MNATANGIAQRFAGKRILVTGSSRGIGAAIARRLAEEGASVAVTFATKPDAAEKVVSTLPGSGHILLKLDISDEASVTAAFEEISAKWGSLDGLVNNAGVTRDTLILRMKADDFSAVVDTNLKGAFLCTRAAVKMMMKSKIAGSIVNITSVIGEMGNAGQSNYAASKAGVEGFAKSIAQEVGSRGIRINCVAPGFIVTDMTDALNENQKTAILSKVPLGTLGDTNDVAAATAFLLSSDAKYITGHTLSVNGGLYM